MLQPAHWQRLVARTCGWTRSLYAPLRVALNAQEKRQFQRADGAPLLIGWVPKDQREGLARFPELFRVDDDSVLIHHEFSSVEERTAAFLSMTETLRDEGEFPLWQDEQYAAKRVFSEPPLFLFHRGVGAKFGLSEFATHLNGFTRDALTGRVDKMWIAKRSAHKNNWPGKLDTIVGGGQPAHGTALANMVKESFEEAGLDPQWTQSRLVATGSISYLLDTTRGLDNNTMFVYDLEMPATLTPVNQDHEVESFELWRVGDVLAVLRDEPERFKPDICLVLLDFLVRHGVLTADNCERIELLQRALHAAPLPYDE